VLDVVVAGNGERERERGVFVSIDLPELIEVTSKRCHDGDEHLVSVTFSHESRLSPIDQ
jgi:hypothetical protein